VATVAIASSAPIIKEIEIFVVVIAVVMVVATAAVTAAAVAASSLIRFLAVCFELCGCRSSKRRPLLSTTGSSALGRPQRLFKRIKCNIVGIED
jgi:hypothetical protein